MDHGKDLLADEKDVWRLVHRLEYERKVAPNTIEKGWVVRLDVRDILTDYTGFVLEVQKQVMTISLMTGPNLGKTLRISFSMIESATEIMSFPLLHRLNSTANGQVDGNNDLK